MSLRGLSSPEYGAAKAGLIRFTSCVSDWADSHRIRVNCVVIGLDRARHEFEQLTDQENRVREDHHHDPVHVETESATQARLISAATAGGSRARPPPEHPAINPT
jgi:NAD(P)-dependent dehydrogenase (short-subunit alcohol dehydrogenase family)